MYTKIEGACFSSLHTNYFVHLALKKLKTEQGHYYLFNYFRLKIHSR